MPVYNLDISPPTLQVTGDPIWSPLAMGLSRAVADIWRANRDNARADKEIAADLAKRKYESDEWKRREDLRLGNDLKLIQARSETRPDKPNIRVFPGEFGAPPTAVRINPDGTLTQVPIAQLDQSKPGVAPPVAPGAPGAAPVPGAGKEPVAPAPGPVSAKPAAPSAWDTLIPSVGGGAGAAIATRLLTNANPVARAVVPSLIAGSGGALAAPENEFASGWGDLAVGTGASTLASLVPGAGKILGPMAGVVAPSLASTARKGIGMAVSGGYDPSGSKIPWNAIGGAKGDPDWSIRNEARKPAPGADAPDQPVITGYLTPNGAARAETVLRAAASETSKEDFPKNAAIAYTKAIEGLTPDEYRAIASYASLLPVNMREMDQQDPGTVAAVRNRLEQGFHTIDEGGKRKWTPAPSPVVRDHVAQISRIWLEAGSDPAKARAALLGVADLLNQKKATAAPTLAD